MASWGCRACGGENPAGTRFCGHCGTAAARDAEEARDERRLVTALFADLSGFTTLADQLEADELHGAVAPVIALLAGVAERFGGTLAKYAGDAVLVFFGAPVAQEDHATRALLCALDMHRQLTDALPRLPAHARHLQMHVGVNTGHVVSGLFGGELGGDYSILGDAVNVAQRLESVAPEGATYVGELTRQLTANGFEFESLGELTLKGKPKPVPAWKLLGSRSVGSGRASARQARLVGRDAELIRIIDVLEPVLSGRDGVVGVMGEPGVGKSRLTDAVRDEADRRGVLWLDARCVSYGASLPYFPYIELLRRAFGIQIEHDPSNAVRQLAAALALAGVPDVAPYFARLLGLPGLDGTADLGQLEPEAFRAGLRQAWAAWLRALATTRPVVLAIEDVHWIDAASVELTDQLIRELEDDAPLLVYLTARPEGSATVSRLAALVSEERRAAIALEPLTRMAIVDLVGELLDGAPSDELAATVIGRSAGNPFFAEELVRSLQDRGALEATSSGWAMSPDCDDSALPPTIEGVLSARIDLLPRTHATVLQQASVIGRRVDLNLLEAIADDALDLPRVIDRLVDAGLLDRSTVNSQPVVSFHHALLVDVAYGRLVQQQRREIHRKVGEASEALYGSGDDVIDLLARHYYLAGAGVKAVDFLQRAGARSKNLFANDEAILHLSRAVELARTQERVASRLPLLLVDVAELEEMVGDYDAAEKLYTEARDATGDVRAWRGLADLHRKRGDFNAALALIDEALSDGRLRTVDITPLWLERTYTLGTAGRLLEAMEAAEAGLAVAPSGSADTAHLRLLLAFALGQAGRPDEALGHALAAERTFERLGDLRGLTRAERMLGDVRMQAGRLDDAVDTLRKGLELAERTGSAEDQAACLGTLGLVELERGNLDEAIDWDRRALEKFAEIGHVAGQAAMHANLAEKLLHQGALDEASASCERGISLARQIDSSVVVADGHRTLARIRLGEGKTSEALALAIESARLYREVGNERNAADADSIAAEAQNGEDALRARD